RSKRSTLGRIRNRFERLEYFERIEPESNIDQLACPQQGFIAARAGSRQQTWTIPPSLDSHRKHEGISRRRPAVPRPTRDGSGLDVSAGGAPGLPGAASIPGRHDNMGGTVSERALQLQHHLAGAVTLEPFVGDRRAGDIAVQVLRLRAALEHAEHELLVLAATLAEEDLEVLHGGRIHALQPERHVARADPSDQLLSLAMLVGQEVAKPAGSGKFCHAAPVCPGMLRQSNALRSRRADLAPRRWPSRRAG